MDHCDNSIITAIITITTTTVTNIIYILKLIQRQTENYQKADQTALQFFNLKKENNIVDIYRGFFSLIVEEKRVKELLDAKKDDKL